jgi:hypothetical protein
MCGGRLIQVKYLCRKPVLSAISIAVRPVSVEQSMQVLTVAYGRQCSLKVSLEAATANAWCTQCCFVNTNPNPQLAYPRVGPV